jgi:hypothetical protein
VAVVTILRVNESKENRFSRLRFLDGLASLIGDYVPTSRQRAAEKVAELLSEKLTELENRVDAEAIDKEDFAPSAS